MRIIISPAKKMRADTDGPAPQALPQFLAETTELMQQLQRLPEHELQTLWKCNSSIAALNVERLRRMDLEHNLTPALLSYDGIQYSYMAPAVFDDTQLAFVQAKLRILSGFYGLLRPYDGVTPYRLEMQSKLAIGEHKDLYAFWGAKPARQLAEESDFIVNLASKEYSKAVQAHLPAHIHFLDCSFGERIASKIVEKGTMCKMARGQMVRWLAENSVDRAEDIKNFGDLGYHFAAAESTDKHYVFIKGD